MHATTQKEFNEIRDERICIVSFDSKSKIRTLLYSGVPYIKAVKHALEQQTMGKICVLATEHQLKGFTLAEQVIIRSQSRFMNLDEFTQFMNEKKEAS